MLQSTYEGFLSRQFVNDYVYYADTLFSRFGDRVKNWMTFNECVAGWLACHGGWVGWMGCAGSRWVWLGDYDQAWPQVPTPTHRQ